MWSVFSVLVLLVLLVAPSMVRAMPPPRHISVCHQPRLIVFAHRTDLPSSLHTMMRGSLS